MISAGDRPANSSLTGQRYLGSRRTAHDAREYLCTGLMTLADFASVEIRSIFHPLLVWTPAERLRAATRSSSVLPPPEHQSPQYNPCDCSEVSCGNAFAMRRRFYTKDMIHRAVVKVCAHIKIRTFSSSAEQLWLDEWENPLRREIPINDPAEFLQQHGQPGYPPGQEGCVHIISVLISLMFKSICRDLRVDKFETGFLLWTPTVKGYQAVPAGPSAFAWEEASRPILQAMSEVMDKDNFFTVLALLWGQESMKNSTTPELRAENVTFMKSIGRQLRSGLDHGC